MSTDHSDATPRRAKRLLLIGFIVMMIIALLYSPSLFDQLHFDETRLLPSPPPGVAHTENFAPVLLAAHERLVEPEGWVSPTFGPDADPVDWAAIDKALSVNQPYLDCLIAGLDRPRFVVDQLAQLSSFDEYGTPFRRAHAWIMTYRAALTRDGRADDAKRLALQWHKMTVQYLEYTSSSIHLLLGLSYEKQARNELVALSFAPEVTEPEIAQLAEAISSKVDYRAKMIDALRQEYRLMSTEVRRMASGAGRLQRWFLFKENQTLEKLGSYLLSAIESLEKRDKTLLAEPWKAPSRWKSAVGGNPTGEVILSVMLPSYVSFLDRTEDAEVQQALSRATLALRRYELIHGELPALLTDLPSELFTAEELGRLQEEVVYDRNARWIGVKRPIDLEPTPPPRIQIQVKWR